MESILRNAVLEKVNEDFRNDINILVVGVGGAGCNAVTNLFETGIDFVDTLAINTDVKHLRITKAAHKHILGKHITRGEGCGGDVTLGRKAAETDQAKLRQYFKERDIVFISVGLGGGTGGGAAPKIAEIAKNEGALVITIATLPFKLEGKTKLERAKQSLREMLKYSDSVITIDNNKLSEYAPQLPLKMAFKLADNIMIRAVKGIAESIVLPSLINVDFADVKGVFERKGLAAILVGEAEGPTRVSKVVEETLNHPLLDINVENADGGIIHLEGGNDLTMGEGIEIATRISEKMKEDAEVKLGARINPNIKDGKVIVTAILTGVESNIDHLV